MIDAELGVSGKKYDEQLAALQSCIQLSVSPFLIARTVLKHHPGIADSEVTRPTMSDAYLHEFAMGLAHFLQVLVSRKHNSLIFRQWLRPSRLAGQSANASRQCRVVQGSTSRLKLRKFLELGGRAAHHKAVAIVCVALCR